MSSPSNAPADLPSMPSRKPRSKSPWRWVVLGVAVLVVGGLVLSAGVWWFAVRDTPPSAKSSPTVAPSSFPAQVHSEKLSATPAFPQGRYSDGPLNHVVVFAAGGNMTEAATTLQAPQDVEGWKCGIVKEDTSSLSPSDIEIKKLLGPTRMCATDAYNGVLAIGATGDLGDLVSWAKSFRVAWQ